MTEENNGGCLDEQAIARARTILSRLCDNGLVSMSIPVRETDEDMILSAVINFAAASLSTSKQAGAAHSQLMKFYGVDSVDALVAAQADHITKLQDRLPRNTAFTVQRVREG